MKIIRSYCMLLCCVVWASASLAQSKTYTVGVEDLEYYPQYSHQGDEYLGFGRELLDAFAKSKGYKFQYKILPVNRLFFEFLKGDTLDFKYPDNAYWEAHLRKGVQVHYSMPVMPFIDGVVVHPDNKGRGIKQFKLKFQPKNSIFPL